MTTDPRIEAAAEAYFHGDMEGVTITELVIAKNRAERLLAASDAVMFSEEAIERAANALHGNRSDRPLEDMTALYRHMLREDVLAVVAVFRGGDA